VNPDLDLTLQRVIRAPRAVVWRAWTDPSQLEQWWVPAPAVARVDRLEAQPGGAFVTRISDDGVEFGPHMDAAFLVVDDRERLVFTNAVDSRWTGASGVRTAAARHAASRDELPRGARRLSAGEPALPTVVLTVS